MHEYIYEPNSDLPPAATNHKREFLGILVAGWRSRRFGKGLVIGHLYSIINDIGSVIRPFKNNFSVIRHNLFSLAPANAYANHT